MQPPQQQPPDDVRRDLAFRRQRVGKEVEKTSGVPLATFGTLDPMVEAKLLDDVVVQMLLQHMKQDLPKPVDPPPEIVDENRVSRADIRELLSELAAAEPEPAPDLLENLPQERLWILVDIAKTGSGLARQRATQELREAMHDLSEWEGVNALVLTELIRLLQQAEAAGESPVLFHTLRIAATKALQRAAGAPEAAG